MSCTNTTRPIPQPNLVRSTNTQVGDEQRRPEKTGILSFLLPSGAGARGEGKGVCCRVRERDAVRVHARVAVACRVVRRLVRRVARHVMCIALHTHGLHIRARPGRAHGTGCQASCSVHALHGVLRGLRARGGLRGLRARARTEKVTLIPDSQGDGDSSPRRDSSPRHTRALRLRDWGAGSGPVADGEARAGSCGV